MDKPEEKGISSIRNRLNNVSKLISSLKPTERIIFWVISGVCIISGLYLINSINDYYSVELPVHGGTYTEGVVGYARFINPILSYTDADKDMVSLVYSGLLRPTPEGKLVPDLAESWNVSDDGLTYSFKLNPDAVFQDGTPVTTDDIEFTINKALDPTIKSPKADNWAGVKIEKVSPEEIHFILQKPYSPFIENMTLGILPKHIWEKIDDSNFVSSINNIQPIGSGPYKIKKSYVNADGVYEYYDLVPFTSYTLGNSYIGDLIVRFYKNEESAITAYKNNTIQGLGGISPEEADKLKDAGYYISQSPLPRVFGLFFNQSQAPVLLNKEVRQALDISVDKKDLIQQVLKGYGYPIDNLVPEGFENSLELSASLQDTATSTGTTTGDLIAKAKKILEDKGWKIGQDGVYIKEQKSGKKADTQRLAFTISTSNVDELKQTAEILKSVWTKLGADVSIEIFETSDLTQKVIRPRKYDALLFGDVVGRDMDLYPFWHSSERNDPGLNVAMYTNAKADKALETIRSTSDVQKKTDAILALEQEVRNDIPAVFLYSPDYIYATRDYVRNIRLSNITNASERFMNIYEWYTETEKVWKIFAKK